MNFMLRFHIKDHDEESSSWVDEEFPAESEDSARVIAIQKREVAVREYGEPTKSVLWKQISWP